MTDILTGPPKREIEISIDGEKARVPEGATILDACRSKGIETPTLCYLETLTPVNACRVCVVELEGSRTLVPACSRKAETGATILTDSERVRLSRKLVLELLASSVDLSLVDKETKQWMERYEVEPARFGPPSPSSPEGQRDARHPGHHHPPDGDRAEDRRPAGKNPRRALHP